METLKKIQGRCLVYSFEKNDFLKLQLGKKEPISFIKLDLKDLHEGHVCISTGGSKITRKGYYTTLVKEAKKFLVSVGYKGLYSLCRSDDAEKFWKSFSKKENVIIQQNAYIY